MVRIEGEGRGGEGEAALATMDGSIVRVASFLVDPMFRHPTKQNYGSLKAGQIKMIQNTPVLCGYMGKRLRLFFSLYLQFGHAKEGAKYAQHIYYYLFVRQILWANVKGAFEMCWMVFVCVVGYWSMAPYPTTQHASRTNGMCISGRGGGTADDGTGSKHKNIGLRCDGHLGCGDVII